MLERVAVVTDEVDPAIRRAVPVLRRLGVTRAELRIVDGARVPGISEGAIAYLRELADGWLALGSLSPGLFKGPMVGAALSAELDVELPATIALARLLGIPRVVVFGGERAARTRDVQRVLVEAATRTREAGVEMVLENSSLCRVATAVEQEEMAEATGLRVVWDPANAMAAGDRALLAGSPRLAGRVASVHVRDWDPSGWQRLGHGVIDWHAQIEQLSDAGYAGDYCVESHRPDDPGATPANVRALVRLLDALDRPPSGKA